MSAPSACTSAVLRWRSRVARSRRVRSFAPALCGTRHDGLAGALGSPRSWFAHTHGKGHSCLGPTMPWLRRSVVSGFSSAVAAIRSALLGTATTVQYEAAREPGVSWAYNCGQSRSPYGSSGNPAWTGARTRTGPYASTLRCIIPSCNRTWSGKSITPLPRIANLIRALRLTTNCRSRVRSRRCSRRTIV